MRIIAGSHRGRKLQSPQDQIIRPTLDRVKGAIFSMIVPLIHEESVILDLFCGTGNMGLEALSRGAGKVYFSDDSKESMVLTKANVRLLSAEDQSVLLRGDYRQNLQRIREPVDGVFVDPPHDPLLYEAALEALGRWEGLREGAWVVFEHDSSFAAPDRAGPLAVWKQKRYGSNAVTIYRLTEKQVDS